VGIHLWHLSKVKLGLTNYAGALMAQAELLQVVDKSGDYLQLLRGTNLARKDVKFLLLRHAHQLVWEKVQPHLLGQMGGLYLSSSSENQS
jgi:hypothetical protein